MVKQIKLTHSEKFSCEYVVNDKLITKSKNSEEHEFSVTEIPCHVKINIQPYKIKPIIRIDGLMVNYGLAEITPWDHMLEFNLHDDWLERYFKNIINAKKQYLSKHGKSVPENMEKYVGINNLYPELVKEIRKIIR